ncbi:MAG: hypothetical protein IPM97_16645 [Bdellovibrionaceae bacterium]|nr:hypothetical protein [Pseudobdellovibrionaceae bacterium]
MNKLIVVLSLVTISSAANAAYWRCEGKKAVVAFSNRVEGLVLSATKTGSEIPANLFRGKVEIDGIVFDNSGKAMKNVSLVFANNSFNTYQAGLNIKDGEFYIDDLAKGKRVFTALNLKCKYSEGE